MISDIIKKSQSFDEKNKELIKNEGVVFTDQHICNKIINKLNPLITDTICEPSVGKFKLLLKRYFEILGFNGELKLTNIVCADYLLQDGYWNTTLGNPPYVRIQNLNKEYLSKIKGDLKSITLGNIDLYYAFIEKSLKSSDKIGFIIPNSFIKTKSGSFLREMLKDKITYLEDFGLKKIWSNISTYTCILICDNKSKLSNWIFTEQNSGENILNNLINYCSGPIATIKDDVFKIDKDFIKNGFKIEQGICKKIIKATKDRNIEDHKYIIYPYDNNIIIDESYLKENYPSVYNYLLSRKDELNSRDKGKIEKYDSWYAYGRKQGLLREINGIRVILPLTFLKSRGIHFIKIPINEDVLNLSGILVDIKENKFEEFINIISSKDFYNYCEINNKILSDKRESNDIWLSITTTTLKNYKF